MSRFHRLLRQVVACVALLGFPILLACQNSRTTYADNAPVPALISDRPLGEGSGSIGSGRVVEAPARITDFAPMEASITVDAATVNLRRIFEDLGPEATLWYQHVQTLANPFFEGRAPATRGLDLTDDYIEFYFRQYGLEPVFPDGSYQQPFNYSTRGTTTVDVEVGTLAVNGRPLKRSRDFVVLGNSGSGDVTAPVTFVGYGIAEGPGGYTSFDEETDLSGRIALLLRYAPMDDRGEPQWSEADHRLQAGLARKMKSVADRGAAAIVLVNPPGAADAPDRLESLQRSRRFGPGLDIPVVQVTAETAQAIVSGGDPNGQDLLGWRLLADSGSVGTVALDDAVEIAVETVVHRTRSSTELSGNNVGGILRGQGDLADEWVVIGAHHDHVGRGDHGGIMPRNRGKLHPGADDNASGTAGVLVLAKTLTEAYEEARVGEDLRSILFVTFDGEEMGLRGSRHFADHSPIGPEKMTLMLNMDMIGRLRSRHLSVLGTDTGEGLMEMLRPHFEASGLTIAVNGGGSGRSDDASFHRMGVPALHFFTGMHPDYTSPADQAYTVNPAGAEEILDLMHRIAYDMAGRPHKLAYKEAAAGPGQDRGYGPVRLGIRPGMGDDVETGVLIDSVSEGTAAAEGGMIGGDVIVQWNDSEITGLRELFEQLQQHQPGDTVKITVLRAGRRVELDVTLKGGGRG